jgi:hypothetical protein
MAPVLYHLLLAVAARVIGDQVGSGKEPHPERIGFQDQALVGVAHRDRVVIALETHPARRTHDHLAYGPDVEWVIWQGTQLRSLDLQACGDSLGAAGHHPLLIALAVFSQSLIQYLQMARFGDGDQIGPPRITHQILHTALLPARPHRGEERFKAVDAADFDGKLLVPRGDGLAGFSGRLA